MSLLLCLFPFLASHEDSPCTPADIASDLRKRESIGEKEDGKKKTNLTDLVNEKRSHHKPISTTPPTQRPTHPRIARPNHQCIRIQWHMSPPILESHNRLWWSICWRLEESERALVIWRDGGVRGGGAGEREGTGERAGVLLPAGTAGVRGVVAAVAEEGVEISEGSVANRVSDRISQGRPTQCRARKACNPCLSTCDTSSDSPRNSRNVSIARLRGKERADRVD
jgi:hypothetical protein